MDVAVGEEVVHGAGGNEVVRGAGDDLAVGGDEPQFVGKHERLGDVVAGEQHGLATVMG